MSTEETKCDHYWLIITKIIGMDWGKAFTDENKIATEFTINFKMICSRCKEIKDVR